MPRTPITSPTVTSVGPYSHAIDDGAYIFCSGQTPVYPGTNDLRTDGVAAQTHQCFDNLFAVLSEAGHGPDDVVSVRVFLTEMADFTEMNGAYAQRFEAPFPARTTIGVASLPLGASVEIDLVAKKRG